MNIALINSPFGKLSRFTREGRCTQIAEMWSAQWPPITLAYIAAIARNEKKKPYIFDCPASMTSTQELLSQLKKIEPKLCIFPVSTPSFENDVAVIKAVKDAVFGTKIAVLGVHATALDNSILEAHEQIDFVIRGEPEITALKLIDAIEKNAGFEDVLGLSYREAKSIRRNPDRPFISDLDSLPFPAWEYVNISDYRLPFSRRPHLMVNPHRGCPYRCSFCTASVYYGYKLRKRSVGSIIEEIKRDIRDFGVKDFFMWADTFTLEREFTIELSRAIRRETPNIRWACNSRTDTVDEEMLIEMASSGCWIISFGIESTDKNVLKNIGKALNSDDFFTPIKLAKKAGIKTVGHFILGLPGDTDETIRKTVSDALNMELDFAQFYVAAPFAGSGLYEQAIKQGWLNGVAFSDMEQSSASLRLPNLPPKRVDRMRKRAILRFYLRPKQILRLLNIARFGILRQVVYEVMIKLKAILKRW